MYNEKVVCALATLAFIGSINVVSADDLMSFLVQIDLEVAL